MLFSTYVVKFVRKIVQFLFCFFLYSYSNIFVTSPSPDNLHTLFEFIFKGFDALQYQVRGANYFTIFSKHSCWEGLHLICALGYICLLPAFFTMFCKKRSHGRVVFLSLSLSRVNQFLCEADFNISK